MEALMKRWILVAFAVLMAFAMSADISVDARGRNVLDGPRMDRSWPPASAYGDEDDDEDDGDDDDDGEDDDECVVLCHKPGTPAEKTKCLPRSAVPAHLGHGDRLGACEDRPDPRPTILDRLLVTDGAQALVAAVLVVDEATGSSIAELLDNPDANLILFAPGNPAFETLLGLDAGALDGLSIETIATALPGLLDGLGLTPEDVQGVLLKHAAINMRGRRKTGTENALLVRGEIEVADGSVFPISIGAGGVAINYESEIIKPDNFASNGVYHFIDAVILDADPPAMGPVIQVFVTSGKWDGDLGGLGGADALCQAAADDGGVGGKWTAWLSDSMADARDRILDGQYQLLDGTVIADGLADLTDGSLNAPIDLDENVDRVMSDPGVWTATESNGGVGNTETCEDWTTTDVEAQGRIGTADASDETWTDAGGGDPCDTLHRLYCFAAEELPPPDETNVCKRNLCAFSEERASKCQDFLDECLMVEDPDECVPTAALFCVE